MSDSVDDDGVKVLPLRRRCPDNVEAIGVAPAFIEFSTSGTRRKEDGTIECKCPKCGAYFSEADLHTDEMCALAQVMND